MVYKCVQKEKDCETCKYEPVCYDSDYIKRLYDVVPPSKLSKTSYVLSEEEDQ